MMDMLIGANSDPKDFAGFHSLLQEGKLEQMKVDVDVPVQPKVSVDSINPNMQVWGCGL